MKATEKLQRHDVQKAGRQRETRKRENNEKNVQVPSMKAFG